MITRVTELAELWSGDMSAHVVGGRRVLLVRFGDEVRAYDDRCPHLGLSLSEGKLEGDVLTCPGHLWTYDARTGCGKNPRNVCLTRFLVRVEQGAVWVDPDVQLAPGVAPDVTKSEAR